jgi:hypothetical protein
MQRMVLFPYNNDTFQRRPQKEWSFAGSPRTAKEGDDMVSTAPAPYYDPYDFDIDADPYPVWKRLRDEAPLYYNEKYDFYAISRYDDVERASVEWQTYSSAKGSVLEIIKAEMEMPPGLFIFEDPPDHDLHRGIMSRVFTPRRMAAIEPQVRDYAARTLDPLVGSRRLRLHPRPRHRNPHAHHRHAPRHPRGGPAGDPQQHRRGPPAGRGCDARGRLRPGRAGSTRTTAPTSTGGSSTPPTTS